MSPDPAWLAAFAASVSAVLGGANYLHVRARSAPKVEWSIRRLSPTAQQQPAVSIVNTGNGVARQVVVDFTVEGDRNRHPAPLSVTQDVHPGGQLLYTEAPRMPGTRGLHAVTITWRTRGRRTHSWSSAI